MRTQNPSTQLPISLFEHFQVIEEEKSISSDKKTNLIIDAYKKGIEDGMENFDKLMFDKFNVNVSRTTEHTKDLLTHISEDLKASIYQAFLKIDNIYSFQVAYLLEEDIFNALEFQLLEKAIELETSTYDDVTYNLSIHFIPLSESFNKAILLGDGYTLKYEPK